MVPSWGDYMAVVRSGFNLWLATNGSSVSIHKEAVAFNYLSSNILPPEPGEISHFLVTVSQGTWLVSEFFACLVYGQWDSEAILHFEIWNKMPVNAVDTNGQMSLCVAHASDFFSSHKPNICITRHWHGHGFLSTSPNHPKKKKKACFRFNICFHTFNTNKSKLEGNLYLLWVYLMLDDSNCLLWKNYNQSYIKT